MHATEGLLESFLGLARADDAAVSKWAAAHGVFFTVDRSAGGERLTLWRSIAHDVALVLQLAAKIHLDEKPTAAEWASFQTARVELVKGRRVNVLLRQPWTPRVPAYGLTERQAIGWMLARWLASSHVGVAFTWAKGEPRFAMRTPSVLGALVVQAAQLASKAEGLAVCRGCAMPFPLRHGNRRYCDPCRNARVPDRAREARYRRRRRQ